MLLLLLLHHKKERNEKEMLNMGLDESTYLSKTELIW